MIDDRQLIAQLVSADLISPDILREGLELAERDDTPLYNVLLDYELLEEQTVVAMASQILKVPAVYLGTADLDAEVAQMIPVDLATNSQSLPLEVIQEDGIDVLRLAMADPIDVMAMDEIASHIGIDIRPVLAGPADIQGAIDRLYNTKVVPPEGPSFEDLILHDDEAHDFFSDDPGDDDPVDIDSDDDIQLSQEFLIEDDDEQGLQGESVLLSGEFVLEADEDEDEVVELDDAFLIEEVDDDGDSPAFDDEPTGLDDGEDSWAAMFDAAAESSLPPYVADEEPLVGEQAEQGTSSSSKSQEEPQQSAGDAGNRTQIGSPAHMGIDQLIADYEAENPLDDEPEDLEETSHHDEAVEQELDEIFELDFADLGESDESEEADSTKSLQKPGRTPSVTPMGIGARAKSSASEDAPQDNDSSLSTKKKKPIVPSSIRAALAKAAKAKKRTATPKEEAPKPAPDKSSPDDAEQDVAKSVLARIAVKQVPQPAFQGAVEKRSDRVRQAQKTPLKGMISSSLEDDSPKTREISLAEMAGLMSEPEKADPERGSATVEMPSNLDAPRILYRLLQLLLSKGLISSEEMDALLDRD